MQSVSERRFRCNACQRTFTRNDHLKRHQLRHTGLKPYSCQFCNTSFSRSDSLRDHYGDCSLRGNRDVPAIGSGGRRRHACSLCVSMKLKCDGDDPCGSCAKRTAKCSNSTDASGVTNPAGNNATAEPTEHALDRGSIRFLLNGGSEGWISGFQFPPTGERSVYQSQRAEVEGSNITPISHDTNGEFGLNLVDDTFGNIFSGPFGSRAETQASLIAPMFHWPDALQSRGISILEQEQPWALSLTQAISSHIPEHSPHRSDLLGNLHFLLTTTRIRTAIDLYFSHWAPNARVIYQHSFDPAKVSPTLLAAVVFMGALYSPQVLDTYAAKTLLDYAELFCFRSRTFCVDAEISSTYTVAVGLSNKEEDQAKFEDLQACYLMVIVQHWAGNQIARRRAMETRLYEVVKVARGLGLTRCRQPPEDRVSEALWLEKEARIRTMAIIVLVDCAFAFFNNLPCRLVASELECDLPSAEAFFDSQHPYSEPGFAFRRPLTVNGAFEQLFACGDVPGLFSTAGLTILDMFIMIHVLYAHISTQTTLLAPLLRIRKPQNIDQDDWAKMGFWRKGYNYWLVAQLLMNHKEKVDSVMRMDFGADKLEKLRLLLQDDVG